MTTYAGQVELWDAINAVVVACGGRSTTAVGRQSAVVAVEAVVSQMRAAARDEVSADGLPWMLWDAIRSVVMASGGTYPLFDYRPPEERAEMQRAIDEVHRAVRLIEDEERRKARV